MTCSTLPYEIYKEIIDHFSACIPQYPSPEYLDSLGVVSLTCKTFVHFARAHIFRQIDISGIHDITGDRRKNLVAFLDKEPHVARSVAHVLYSFIEGEEHLFKKSLEGLLQCITTLPRMKDLTIVVKPQAADKSNWLAAMKSPPAAFGWKSILDAFISRDVVLDTLSMTGSRFSLLCEASSIPSVRNLVLNCFMLGFDKDEEVHKAAQANRCTLTSFKCLERAQFSYTISFDFIAQCTQLSEIALRGGIYYPGYAKDLPARIGFNISSDLPFQKLSKAEFHGREYIEWDFYLACTATRGAGVVAFPELRDLSINMIAWVGHDSANIASDSLAYGVFKHMPVLETLSIHGGGFYNVPVGLAKALHPLSPTLKTLSLHCNFETNAFVWFADRYIPLPQFLNTLESLDLAVLERLSLHIQLETSTRFSDETTNPPTEIYRSVAKSVFHTINNVLLKSYTHFLSLKKLELKITMMVYFKDVINDPDEEEPYRRKAIETLRRYLKRINADGKFEFVWEVDVFQRYCREAGIILEEEVEGDGETDSE